MIRYSYGMLGLGLAVLAGCASNSSEPATEPVAPRASASSAIPASGLGPQQLAPGECGLFLWSKTDSSKFIFFSRATSGQALFKYQDNSLNLQQVSAGGTIFGQFNTEQGYQTTDGQSVALTFESGARMDGGQRIDNGLITVTDAEGWRTKLPVLGIRACLPE